MSDPAPRTERDFLGELVIPAGKLYGIHAARAAENFPLAGRPPHPALIHAYGTVKLAAARTNREQGAWADDAPKADAIERACHELAEGLLDEHIVVDLLQGGAGTSLNMNVNEVIANRALQLLGGEPGTYDRVSPLNDVNRHQSTNDTYPTALKLAAIRLVRELEHSVVALQESFQAAERRFAHIVKVARTQLQDAVLTTLGCEMAAYAEALGRDRWRIYKCEERLRVINLGGTAIGSGLAAPRRYIFCVTERLRELTGIGFARCENMVENTQNADVYVEVSGMLKALATSLVKISSDLRLMGSGPEAGLGELRLPPRQAGSSIMPGKVNPVIPEAVTQVAWRVMGHDAALTNACAGGNFELNPFLPLVAASLLESLTLLARACDILRKYCIEGLEANEPRLRAHIEGSTATATALLPVLGYHGAAELLRRAAETGRSIRDVAIADGLLSAEEFAALVSPEPVCRLGQPAGESCSAHEARGPESA